MIIKAILTLAFVYGMSTAQLVNISGVVKKSSGGGLEGVRVKLGKTDLVTTTDTEGRFTLNNDPTALMHSTDNRTADNNCLFFVGENKLFLRMAQAAKVNVTVYDCNGKLLMDCGESVAERNCSITLPRLGSGVKIYRVSVKNRFLTLKAISGLSTTRPAATMKKDIGLVTQARSAERIDDALMFIKSGYQYYRIPIKNPDTSGMQITMTPLDTGTITDAEGNVYKTVRIGNQYWTAENLRSTKYNDGSSIGNACLFYNNTTDAAARKKWGALYTDAAVNSGKLAPTGWRVPTNADWDTLVNYLISHGYNYDGTTKTDKIAKSLAATTDWELSTDSGAIGNDLSLNNASGFSALPAGWKFWDGKFEKQGSGAYWWIAGSGAANVADLWWIFRSLDRYSTIYVACSVRLVRHI